MKYTVFIDHLLYKESEYSLFRVIDDRNRFLIAFFTFTNDTGPLQNMKRVKPVFYHFSLLFSTDPHQRKMMNEKVRCKNNSKLIARSFGIKLYSLTHSIWWRFYCTLFENYYFPRTLLREQTLTTDKNFLFHYLDSCSLLLLLFYAAHVLNKSLHFGQYSLQRSSMTHIPNSPKYMIERKCTHTERAHVTTQSYN